MCEWSRLSCVCRCVQCDHVKVTEEAHSGVAPITVNEKGMGGGGRARHHRDTHTPDAHAQQNILHPRRLILYY